MNTNLLSCAFISITLFSPLTFAAGAHLEDQASSPEPLWRVIKHGSGNVVELAASGGAGNFGAACQANGCVFFVEPASGCHPGQRYPLLLNTARSVGVVPSECTIMKTEGQPGRRVARVLVHQALFAPIEQGLDVSIAFPTQAGSVDVIAVSTNGLRSAIKKLQSFLPAVDKAPTSEPEDRFKSL